MLAHHVSPAIRPEDDGAADWRGALRLAWSVYWPIRLLLIAVGVLASLAALQPTPDTLGGWLQSLFITPWNQQDAPRYMSIAQTGYAIADGRSAFHPLLPLLMAGLGRLLGGQYILAGLIVNDLACVGVLATLYRLVALDYPRKIARNTLVWMLYSPVGFMLLLPYTETLALGWILLSFWFARHDRWLAAGLCGALATLAKQPAIVLLLALLVEYLASRRTPLISWRSVQVAACISLVGFGYLAFSLYRIWIVPTTFSSLGELFGALVVSPQINQLWGSRFGWQTEWLVTIVRFSLAPDTYGWYWIQMALTVAGLILFGLALRHTRRSIAVFCGAQVFLMTTIILLGDPLMSTPRRFILVFIVFIQLGIWSSASEQRHRWRFIGLAVQVLLFMGYAMGKFVP
ncbi:MAG: hypothetical protein H0T53_00780 [Herpetosiphonaceae bacterium]|nr:hypothetical protein [Herpetosiphonaceae bacterium]